jgi:hypothetical protein
VQDAQKRRLRRLRGGLGPAGGKGEGVCMAYPPFRLIQARYPERTQQDLLAEALNDLFAKYNVPQSAKL